jgi:hypothetical protein
MRGTLVVLALALAVGCGGKQVPQHTGYKGKKPTPWTKAKPIELDEEYKAKVSGELDYGEFKRAKWYSLTLPGPGSVDFNFEFVPGTDEDMDVAFEVLDPNNKVLVRADAESEDVNEQKKQRKLEDLPEGRYLIHVYLQGRLDTADFDLKLQFARGTAVWKSDFPNQVPYPDELPAVPPFDDTPSSAPPPRCGVPGKPKCPKRCGTPGAQPCRPPPPQETCGVPGKPPCALPPISASITNVDPDPSGARITVAAGTGDDVQNGMKGYVKGVKGANFTLGNCTATRCTATVKAAVDDVRSSGEVIIKRQ